MRSILYNIIVLGFLFFSLTTCKKYPDGGFVNQTRKHLFGGNDVGDNKTWKLKLYEVNGIDSTYLIQGAASIPDFYEKFVTFELTERKSISCKVNTFLYTYNTEVDNVYKKIGFGMKFSKEDTTQCKLKDNKLYCHRNIFFPEFQNKAPNWSIVKLKKDELILALEFNNSYKIILTQ